MDYISDCLTSLEECGLSAVHLVFDWFTSIEECGLPAVHFVFDCVTSLVDSGLSASLWGWVSSGQTRYEGRSWIRGLSPQAVISCMAN